MGHFNPQALMPRLPFSIPGLSTLLRRQEQSSPEEPASAPSIDPLLEAGQRLKAERESRGLNLRQMALETRISTPVLEALERGWRDRLPEGAYLKAMLPMIEQHLGMPAGSLAAALPEANPRKPIAIAHPDGGWQGLNLGSIDIFTTWQGSVLYVVATLGLIYGLNLHQRVLLQPIPAQALQSPSKPGSVGSGTLLTLYPELKPIQQAKRGVGLAVLGRVNGNGGGGGPAANADALRPGVLQLNLSKASTIELSSESGARSSIKGASGELTLQLKPPFKLQIAPPPQANEVLWDAQPLKAISKEPGTFQLPAQRP